MQQLVDALERHFAGRTDVYAIGKVDPDTNKARYFTVEEPLTRQVLEDHVSGRRLVGVYPIVQNRVKWFALDIDSPGDEHEELSDAVAFANVVLPDAKEQLEALESAGLHCYLERSRSGTGAHIWGFLDEWVDAATVRKAIKPLLTRPETFDRMYPVQDELTDRKPLGNLICLPFHGEATKQGGTCFIDPQLAVTIEPAAFLAELRPNAGAVMRHLAAKAPKEPRRAAPAEPAANNRQLPTIQMGRSDGRPARLINGVLKLVSPYGCEFMRKVYQHRANPKIVKEPAWYAAIGQLTVFENGRDAAHCFSQGYPGYNPDEVDQKFDHALENPPVGCAYIHEHFPRLACKSCPMTAPYHRAQRKLSELLREGDAELISGGWKQYLPTVRDRDAGVIQSGIPWGLGELDRFTKFRPGELTVIGAQVSMGKTASMIALAANVARQGFAARVFSGEMGEDGLRERVLAHFANVDSLALRGERQSGPLTPDEWEEIEWAVQQLETMPLELNFTATSPERILLAVERSVLRRRQPFERPYVTFFDYLQFASKEPEDDGLFAKVSRTAKELKLVAKVLGQPVATFSQVIRPAEGASEPNVTWFKGSGDIEAETDVGVIWTGERMEGRFVPRVGTIVKQRNGQANVRAEFMLDQATSRYEPVRPPAAPQRPPLFEEGEY